MSEKHRNIHSKFCKTTRFQEQLENGKIKCLTCRHSCILSEGQKGICETRQVRDGVLKTLNYGNISSISINPIEKKPFYHFFPGSYATTIGSWSCNLSCPWCQNYSISKKPPEQATRIQYLSPEDLAQSIVHDDRSSGVSFSFNEPTLMIDYALDVLQLLFTKKADLFSNFVTNGYMSLNVLQELIQANLSAMVVSIKGDKKNMQKWCNANLEFIFENINYGIKNGLHVEIVVLVIPSVSDSESYFDDLTQQIINDFGPNIPLHFNAYYPAYHFHKPRTSPKTLERAREIAMKNGLNFVYVGNLLGHPAIHTYCPTCSEKVMLRTQFGLKENKLIKDKYCPYCDTKIPIYRISS